MPRRKVPERPIPVFVVAVAPSYRELPTSRKAEWIAAARAFGCRKMAVENVRVVIVVDPSMRRRHTPRTPGNN